MALCAPLLPGFRERLTGKASTERVVAWNVLFNDGPQVPLGAHGEVLLVEIAEILVNLTCENAFMPQGTERKIEASESGTKIGESKTPPSAQLS